MEEINESGAAPEESKNQTLKIFDPPKNKEDCNAILEESRILMQQQIEYWRQLPANKK